VVLSKLGPRKVSEADLTGWGKRIGGSIEPPLWISLIGPLGAGKSVLARAVCRGSGVTGHITSPSFTLVQRYDSPRGFEIVHVDLFRLRSGEAIEPLGWDDLLSSSGVVILEWADRAGDQQPEDRWEIRMSYGEEPSRRVVTIDRLGAAPDLLNW
jgi:tRNA threonylcarbamoyladenosine biosynthesis protein TsaE